MRRCEVGDGHRSVGAAAQHRTSNSSGAASAGPLDLRALLPQPPLTINRDQGSLDRRRLGRRSTAKPTAVVSLLGVPIGPTWHGEVFLGVASGAAARSSSASPTRKIDPERSQRGFGVLV